MTSGLVIDSADQLADERNAIKKMMKESKPIDLSDDEMLQLSHVSVEKSTLGILWLDSQARVYRVNESACKILGYTMKEFLGLSIPEFDIDLPIERFEPAWDMHKKEGIYFAESRYKTKDDRIIPVEINSHFVKFKGREYSCAFFRDITERKQRENELKVTLRKLNSLQNRLQKENTYLREEIEVVHNFQKIIGQSHVIKQLLKEVTQVASTDATVLLFGETGTGKELIARAVHNSSIRKDRALVKVNCAALPHNLIESSLFGHKKGAFTGAVSDNTGKFELADGGTIFLDEIGELPLELQTKLLRVLQDGEVEKLGQSDAIKVDVRVIAATNRNLEKMIETKKFRQDLYYRLNVFPIKCPPLRDRTGDVPILAKYFIDKYNSKIGRNVSRISKKVMDILESYHWPGNVRELENIIERALIISQGKELTIGNWFYQDAHDSDNNAASTLQGIERKHIKKILESTSWRVSGKGGAAEKLGLKPTTLEARMKKLGIERPK